MYDQRIDAAQHGIDAVEVGDPVLGFLALGDVTGDAEQHRAFAVRAAHGGGVSFEPAPPALESDDLVFQNTCFAAHHALMQCGKSSAILGHNEIERRSRLHRGERVGLQHGKAGRVDLQQRPLLAHDLHALGLGLDDGAQSLFAGDEIALGLAMGRAHLRLVQLAFQRRRQPRQALFHHVVAGAGLHRIHRGFLAHDAGNEDERNVEAAGTENPQRIHAGEPRHIEVRDDCVPSLLRQRGFQVRRGLHAPVLGVEAAAAQRSQRQHRVVFGVLDDQYFERLVHAALRSGGA